MNKLLILSFALCLAAGWLWAGNSIFSYDGFPVQYYGTDIYSLGMGDTGASDIFRINAGYGNPAMSSLGNRTLFSTGILAGYNRYRSRDGGGDYSYLDNSLDFPYFSLSVPVKSHRVGFQFHSQASGVVENQREFNGSLEKQSMDRYLFRGDLIYSYAWPGFQAGVSGNYYFGHETRNLSRTDADVYFNTREELSRGYSNPSLTAGVLKYFDNYSFGAYYGLRATLKGDETRTSIHEEEQSDCEYKLPDRFGLSGTARLSKEIKVASDLNYELWSQINEQDYRDGWKLGLGLAYEPAPDKDKKVFLRLPLRAGAAYRQLPFRSGGEYLDELTLSGGMSLKFKDGQNRIDIGFQYLQRGSLDQNGLSDNSFMLMFGFTGSDLLNKAANRSAPREIPVKEDAE